MPGSVCQKCGFSNPTGMRFCGNCGTRLPVPTAYLQSVTPLPEDLPSSVGVMMGANLAERFRQAGIEAAGQRRNVTILFVDLAGFTGISRQSDDEETYLLIQQFINLMARDVYKYDGMVDKFLGDGLMAIFGAPIAHENNAELAVRAALDMQADALRLSRELSPRLGAELRLHIGLHSGSVVVGSLGSNLLMNYTAIGDTVNLAYRFLQEAPAGAIYASQAVYQETHGLADFEQLGPLALKGFPDPVPGYAVVQLKSKPGPARGIEGMRAPLVGRDAEMTQLRRAQQALIASKEGRFILIQGEAGIGKSRLTEEFCASLEQAGLRCLVGHSFIYRRLVSYWIFQELFHALLDLPVGAPEDVLRARLAQTAESLLGSQAVETLPYLEYLLSLKPSNEEAAERLLYLDAAELRQQVFLAARDLLVAEARQSPLVLVFEDLHWADEASLDLICFLIDSVRQEPLLALAVARPSPETALRPVIEKADRVLSERFTVLLLQSLSARQSERLFQELLSGPNLPEEICQRIIQRSGGNPFYLEEIVRMLIDDRLLYSEEGQWKLAPGADISLLGVPETLQGLILARFDRLSPLERRILQVASVIGRNFDIALLEEVLALKADLPVLEALGSLVERGFIQPPEEGVRAGYILLAHAGLGCDLRHPAEERPQRAARGGGRRHREAACRPDRRAGRAAGPALFLEQPAGPRAPLPGPGRAEGRAGVRESPGPPEFRAGAGGPEDPACPGGDAGGNPHRAWGRFEPGRRLPGGPRFLPVGPGCRRFQSASRSAPGLPRHAATCTGRSARPTSAREITPRP